MLTLTEPDLSQLRDKLERNLRVKLQELDRASALLGETVADVRSRLIKNGTIDVWLMGPAKVQGLGAYVDRICGEVIALQEALKRVADQQAHQAAAEDESAAG